MKKVGIITENKVFAQSLAAVRHSREYPLQFFILRNPRKDVLDAELIPIDVALVDISMRGAADGREAVFSLCARLREALPDCRLLLLASQEDSAGRSATADAVQSGLADDFVFYDTSLDYLLTKLAAI